MKNQILLLFVIYLCVIYASQTLSHQRGLTSTFRPGSGYVDSTHWIMPVECLKASQTEANHFYSPFQLDTSCLQEECSLSEIENALNINVANTGSYGMFSRARDVEFMKMIQNTRYSQNFNYLFTYSSTTTLKINDSGEGSLTLDAQSMLRTSKNTFTIQCGDHYIQKSQAGAILIITIQLQFVNAEERAIILDKLPEKATIQENIIAIKKGVAKLPNNNYEKGSVKVMICQRGGDEGTIKKYFAGNYDSELEIGSLVCGFSNMQNCFTWAQNLASKYPSTLAAQIPSDQQGPKNQEKLHYFGVEQTTRYPGITYDDIQWTQLTTDIQGVLFRYYTSDTENRLNAFRILHSKILPKLDSQLKKELAETVESLKRRLQLYSSSELDESCFGPRANEECPTYFTNFNLKRDSYMFDNSTLRHLSDDCYQFLDFTDNDFQGFIVPISNNQYQYLKPYEDQTLDTVTQFTVKPQVEIVMELEDKNYIQKGTFQYDLKSESYSGPYEKYDQVKDKSDFKGLKIIQVGFPL